jgi:D-3-phosphoglycerate dehydrogenase
MPHLGACTPESEDRCAVMAANELYDYLLNGNIKNSVNLPDVSLARLGVCRLCVIHHNVPKMINRILDRLGVDVNVEHMINKARGEYAYTMIDLGSTIDEATIERISSIENVLRVRVI